MVVDEIGQIVVVIIHCDIKCLYMSRVLACSVCDIVEHIEVFSVRKSQYLKEGGG